MQSQEESDPDVSFCHQSALDLLDAQLCDVPAGARGPRSNAGLRFSVVQYHGASDPFQLSRKPLLLLRVYEDLQKWDFEDRELVVGTRSCRDQSISEGHLKILYKLWDQCVNRTNNSFYP